MELTVERAAPGDDEGIRRLLRREAMPGRIRVAYEREPNFALGCAVTGDRYDIIVARAGHTGEVVGVAVRSARRAFVNGREARIGYLGQLRIDRRFRGRWLLSRGFSLLARMDRDDPLPLYFASIVDGNAEAEGVLVRRRRPGHPAFEQAAGYCTLVIPVRLPRRALAGAESITAGSPEQIAELAGFLRTHGARRQLAPVWTDEGVRGLAAFGLDIGNVRLARRGGAIAGVIGLWDQSAYKQAVVRGYSGWLKAASWLGGLIVPRVGTPVRTAYASMVCVAGDDPGVFRRLLREAYRLAAAAGFDHLVVGLDARDPLLPVARAYPHVAYPSRLYLASWANGGGCHEPLDGRPAYVDVATL